MLTTKVRNEESFVPFIIETWMKSMRVAYRDVDDDRYYAWAKPHVRAFIQASDTVVEVDELDRDTIVSYIVHTGPTAHWAYTRKDLRQHGFFKGLLEGIHQYSHRPYWWQHKRGGLLFVPWYID